MSFILHSILVNGIMFDFTDFVVCVESLLLGSDFAQELWQRQTPTTIPTTWRTPVQHNGEDQPPLDPQRTTNDSSTSEFVLEFIDIVFNPKGDAGKKSSCPSMQLGAFFSSPSAPMYALSVPLSAKDIAEHYNGIGAELDEYSSDEHLNLAKMFVKSLRNFHRTPVPTCDKVILFYQEFELSLEISLKDASRQELTAPFAAAALLGLANSSRFTTGNEDDGKINAFRELVKASRSKDSPIKSQPDTLHNRQPHEDKSPTPKPKPANRKRTQRAVLQKRAKTTKLLPK